MLGLIYFQSGSCGIFEVDQCDVFLEVFREEVHYFLSND